MENAYKDVYSLETILESGKDYYGHEGVNGCNLNTRANLALAVGSNIFKEDIGVYYSTTVDTPEEFSKNLRSFDLVYEITMNKSSELSLSTGESLLPFSAEQEKEEKRTFFSKEIPLLLPSICCVINPPIITPFVGPVTIKGIRYSYRKRRTFLFKSHLFYNDTHCIEYVKGNPACFGTVTVKAFSEEYKKKLKLQELIKKTELCSL
jgi:hypothetical protein